jgi:integrase
MSKRDPLPASLPPRGLSRGQAAAYIGVSPVTFDEMVKDGRMPPPKAINARRVWDRHALDTAFAELDDAGAPAAAASWLVNTRGKPFTADYFYEWFMAAVEKAGLPPGCVPHGVRKRACVDLAHHGVTTQEGMAISGHRDESMWQLYVKDAEREKLAKAGMAKRTAAEQKRGSSRR